MLSVISFKSPALVSFNLVVAGASKPVLNSRVVGLDVALKVFSATASIEAETSTASPPSASAEDLYCNLPKTSLAVISVSLERKVSTPPEPVVIKTFSPNELVLVSITATSAPVPPPFANTIAVLPFATVTVVPLPCLIITLCPPEVEFLQNNIFCWSLGSIVTVLSPLGLPLKIISLYIPSDNVPSVVVRV